MRLGWQGWGLDSAKCDGAAGNVAYGALKAVDITLANLSNLKTGKARAVGFSTLEAICRVLECPPGDVLVFRDETHGRPGGAGRFHWYRWWRLHWAKEEAGPPPAVKDDRQKGKGNGDKKQVLRLLRRMTESNGTMEGAT